MKPIHYTRCLFAGALIASSAGGAQASDHGARPSGPKQRVLLYDHAPTGSHIESRANLRAALSALAEEQGFELVASRDHRDMTYQTLRTFGAVVVSNSDGAPPSSSGGNEDLDRYVREGGGLVAIHAAAAHLRPSSPMAALISRPWARTLAPSSAKVGIQADKAVGALGILIEGLPATAELRERWMEFENVDGMEKGTVVLRTGELFHRGETIGGQPVVWARPRGAGRIVYNALGKENVYAQADHYGRKLLWNSLRYARGEGEATGIATPERSPSLSASTTWRVEPGRLNVSLGAAGPHKIFVHDSKGRLLARKSVQGPGVARIDGLRGLLHLRVEQGSERLDRRISAP